MIQRYANFWFYGKGSGTIFQMNFVYYISGKISVTLYFINLPNFIVWLPLLLEILDNMCIVLICFLAFDVKNVEINLNFVIKPFFYITKKVRTKIKTFYERKELLRWNKNNIFIILKRLLVARNYLGPGNGRLIF